MDPSHVGQKQAAHTAAPLSCVQVFTGGAFCQMVDSEEEPEDGEEEVGRSSKNGRVCANHCTRGHLTCLQKAL